MNITETIDDLITLSGPNSQLTGELNQMREEIEKKDDWRALVDTVFVYTGSSDKASIDGLELISVATGFTVEELGDGTFGT